jgi:NAD-dependent dihydropyrimidine dehydrogenase PreA subunit
MRKNGLKKMNHLIYFKDVTTLQLDIKKCIGCGMCTQVCPHEVFAVNSKKAGIINKDACMECGACQMNCPTAAISVNVGVGCAAAVINSALGLNSSNCCCNIESPDSPPDCGSVSSKTSCC